ncbi:hypothetical protein ES703_27564 [subsurface metagenome]
MKLAGKIRFKVTDRDGNLILEREQPSRSFLLHFIELLYVYHGQIDRVMDDVGGTTRTVKYTMDASARYSKPNLSVMAPPSHGLPVLVVGHDTFRHWQHISDDNFGKDFGIVVGTGAGAPTPQDNALAQKILHGRGTGQLEYGGSEVLEPAFSDPNAEMLLRRYFTNRSGATITITECGAYAIGADYYTTADTGPIYRSDKAWPFCIIRDLVTPNIDVLTTEILEVTYLIQTTV